MAIGILNGMSLDELQHVRKRLQEDLKRVDAAIGEMDPHNVKLEITVSTGDKENIKYIADLAESCAEDVSSIGGDIRLIEQQGSRSNLWEDVTLFDLREGYEL